MARPPNRGVDAAVLLRRVAGDEPLRAVLRQQRGKRPARRSRRLRWPGRDTRARLRKARCGYRGLATEDDDPKGGPFAGLLAKYGARRFVTGHTPQQNARINTRFGGRAILIDTGMLASYYMGRPAALEILGDKLTAIYEDGRIALPIDTPAGARQ